MHKNLDEMIPFRTVLSGSTQVHHLAWAPDGGGLAISLEEGSVAIWQENRQNRRLAPTPLQPRPQSHLAWSPDGDHLACCDRVIRVLDVRTGKIVAELEQACSEVHALAWSASGDAIHAALVQGLIPDQELSLARWPWPCGQLDRQGIVRQGTSCYDAVSSNRQLLALSLPQGEIQLWDIVSLQCRLVLPAGFRDVRAVSSSPEKDLVALGFIDGTIELWDSKQGSLVQILPESRTSLYSLDFSPDGLALAGRSADRKLRIWSTRDWRCVAEQEEPGGVQRETDLAFNPCRLRPAYLASCNRRNTEVYLWEVDMERLAATPVKILFLSADPFGNLRIDQEIREIKSEIRQSKYRDLIDLQTETAIRVADFSRAIVDFDPDIVHFAGHGGADGAILVEDETGRPHPMNQAAVARLFSLMSGRVRCVVLNACHSALQADAIAKYIRWVVAMREPIDDEAAVAFSVGFYQALGAGKPVDNAFQFGCSQIDLRNLSAQPALFESPATAPEAEIYSMK